MATLSVTTYNLWHGLNGQGVLYFGQLEPQQRREQRYRHQEQLLKGLGADVYFCQELSPLESRARLLEQRLKRQSMVQADSAGVKIAGVGIPWNLESGLGTFVRPEWFTREVKSLKLSGDKASFIAPYFSWQLHEMRYALFSEGLHPRWGRILFVNTHLHHGAQETREFRTQLFEKATEHNLSSRQREVVEEFLQAGDKRRCLEIQRLLRFLDSLEKRYSLVLLAGDFNSSPESEVYKQVIGHGFADAWADNTPEDPGWTWDPEANAGTHGLLENFELPLGPIQTPFFPEAFVRDCALLLKDHDRRKRRIDYLFWKTNASVNLEVKNIQRIGIPRMHEEMAGSDHFGLFAEWGEV